MTTFKRAFFLGTAQGYTGAPNGLFGAMCDAVVAAEQAGFDAVLVSDHFIQSAIVGGPDAPMLEAYTLLGALAARTDTVRLGTLVSPVIFRNPAQYAKMVTSLDLISGGRAIAGFGAGWDEGECLAYGIDFPRPGERMDRLEEALTLAKLMFTQPRSSFNGRHYTTVDAYNVPGPVGPMPILVGGGGEKRTLRIAAQHADACNVGGDVAQIAHKFAVLDRHCAEVGRDPAAVQRTAGMPRTPDMADPVAYAAAVEERLAVGATGLAQSSTFDTKLIESWGRILLDLVP